MSTFKPNWKNVIERLTTVSGGMVCCWKTIIQGEVKTAADIQMDPMILRQRRALMWRFHGWQTEK